MFKSASEIRSVTLAMNSLTNCSCIKTPPLQLHKGRSICYTIYAFVGKELNCLIGSLGFSFVFCLHEYHDIFYFFEIFRRNFLTYFCEKKAHIYLCIKYTLICVLLFHCYICDFFSLIYLCIYFASIYVISFHSYICDLLAHIYE